MENTSEPSPERPPEPPSRRLGRFHWPSASGTKQLGVAVSNPDQTIASPVENYTRQGLQADTRFLRRLVEEYRPLGIIVGLPVHMSGDEGGKAREARDFGSWIVEITGLPVRYADERFSSFAAEQHLLAAELSKKKRKARLDMLAAQGILQGYLEKTHKAEPPGAM